MNALQKLKSYGSNTLFFNKTLQLPMLMWHYKGTSRKNKSEPSINHPKVQI
jgi:hypothetical protein